MKILKKIINNLKTKNGNSYLFMPYLVTFGVTIMYIAMEMGTAYVRQIELQTVTDAASRAGAYAGMTGSNAQFTYIPAKAGVKEHIAVDLDDANALQLGLMVLKSNVKNISGLSEKPVDQLNPGQYSMQDVRFCDPIPSNTQFAKYIQNQKVPVYGSDGKYHWTKLQVFKNNGSWQGVMATGNFYVSIDGQYKTMVADNILGMNTITLRGFASSLATARIK